MYDDSLNGEYMNLTIKIKIRHYIDNFKTMKDVKKKKRVKLSWLDDKEILKEMHKLISV